MEWVCLCLMYYGVECTGYNRHRRIPEDSFTRFHSLRISGTRLAGLRPRGRASSCATCLRTEFSLGEPLIFLVPFRFFVAAWALELIQLLAR